MNFGELLDELHDVENDLYHMNLYAYKMRFGMEGTQEICTICYEQLDTGDVETRETRETLPCDHSFHVPCIRKWLETDNTCPVCRAEPSMEFHISTINGDKLTMQINSLGVTMLNNTSDEDNITFPWSRIEDWGVHLEQRFHFSVEGHPGRMVVSSHNDDYDDISAAFEHHKTTRR